MQASHATRLGDDVLGRLPAGIGIPRYDRGTVTPGIVHLGLGAFHRAHQAAYVDECLAAGQAGWGIVGASLQSPRTRDALGPQGGLYTLAEQGPEGERLSVLGAISGNILVAPEEPAALVATLADPRIRLVTLTVTEKAYLRGADGRLDLDHAALRADLADPARPRTVHGFLGEAIARRRRAGIPPFTVLCCDNLPANGATVRGLVLDFLRARDSDLAAFARGQIAFPSSMVDRIVPATTDADRRRISDALDVEDAWPVVTEPFRQWVVEDHFPAGRPDWEPFGVTMVHDVRPFEEMKLRLLNSAHSALAYLGLLLGYATVDAAFADPAIRRFVDALWDQAIPTLPGNAGLEPRAYVAELARRFSNPALKHRTAQIANDGSQKLPQRILGPALDRLERGAAVTNLAFAVAAWLRAAETRGQRQTADAFTDPLDAMLTDIVARCLPAGDAVAEAFDKAGFAAGSPHRPALVSAVAGHLAALRAAGPAAALSSLEGRPQP